MALPGNPTLAKPSRPISPRYQFLDDLIEGLTTYEWRYLRDRLLKRSFRCDVFGMLPLEIAFCVAAYLGPLDIVVSRRVSKRWYSLLTAQDLSMLVYLDSWPQQDLPDSVNWTEHLDQRLCCEHSLACGRPWSKAEYSESFLNMPSGFISPWQFFGSNLSWCATAGCHDLREHIAVLSVGAGNVSRYFPSRRSPLRVESIALSDILVGCISSDGNCELFEIRRGTCHSFRLPSTRYQTLIIQGDKIACISMDAEPLRSIAFLDIITWDLISKAHRQISLEILIEEMMVVGGRADMLGWILGYDSIHMMEPGMSSEICVTEVGVSIYQAQDAVMSPSVCTAREISIEHNRVISSKRFLIAGHQPTWLPEDKYDIIMIPQQEIGTDWRYYFKLASLDCWVYSFRSQHSTYGHPGGRLDGLYTAPRPLSASTYGVMLGAAQSICFKFITWQGEEKILQEVVPEIPDKGELVQLQDEASLRFNFFDPPYSLSRGYSQLSSLWPWLGNNRFFIIAGYGMIKVYCFDKEFVMSNEDVSFRKGREEKAEARKAKRLQESHALNSPKGCADRR